MDTPQNRPNNDSTDSKDEIPLARIKKSKVVDEDAQPLATLRVQSMIDIVDLKSDSNIDSLAEYRPVQS